MKPEKWHGTRGGYTNHGCRCAPCRRAHADYHRDYWRAHVKVPERKDPGDASTSPGRDRRTGGADMQDRTR